MISMSELSPAAQAVLDSYNDARDGEYIDGEWIQDETGQIAAALRAAAEPFHWTWNAEMCHKHLIAIAVELEAQ